MVKETIAYLENLLAHPAKNLNCLSAKNLLNSNKNMQIPEEPKFTKAKSAGILWRRFNSKWTNSITLTDTGYIKRQSLNSFRTQQRGGKGIIGHDHKNDEDMIADIKSLETHDNIYSLLTKEKFTK